MEFAGQNVTSAESTFNAGLEVNYLVIETRVYSQFPHVSERQYKHGHLTMLVDESRLPLPMPR